jgi:hypothetical protein
VRRKIIFFLLFLTFFTTISFSTPIGNGKWYVVDSPHFRCIFYENDYATAEKVLGIAEDALVKISDALGYDYKDDLDFKIPIVLVDYIDISNGSADMFNKTIKIYLYQRDIIFFGGNLPWLRRVVSHELTHIITALLMNINYADLINPIMSISKFGVPDWFLEGTARYFGEEWDYSKESLIVNSFLNRTILSYYELSQKIQNVSVFESNLIYEEGQSIISYIVSIYSSKAIGEIYKKIGQGTSFDLAFQEVLKEFPRELYQDWQRWEFRKISNIFKKYNSPIGSYYKKYNIYNYDSYIEVPPIFSSDGEYTGLVSSFSNSNGVFNLFVLNNKTGKKFMIDSFVGKYFDMFDKKIYYTRLSYYKDGYYSDLYVYDIKNRTKTRLTYGARVQFPSVFNNNVLLSKFEDGENKIVLFNLKSKKFIPLSDIPKNWDCQYLKYNPNLNLLLFRGKLNNEYFIGVYDFSLKKSRILIKNSAYKINPIWIDNKIVYISNFTGIPQLFEVNLNGLVTKITNFNTGVYGVSYYKNTYYLSIMDSKAIKVVKVDRNLLSRYRLQEAALPKPTLTIESTSIRLSKEKPYSTLDNMSTIIIKPTTLIFPNAMSSTAGYGLNLFLEDTLGKEYFNLTIQNSYSTNKLLWNFSYGNYTNYPDIGFSIKKSELTLLPLNTLTSYDLYGGGININVPMYPGLTLQKELNLSFDGFFIPAINAFAFSQRSEYNQSFSDGEPTNIQDTGYNFSIVENGNYYISNNLNDFSVRISSSFSTYYLTGAEDFPFGEVSLFLGHNFGYDGNNYMGIDPFLGVPLYSLFIPLLHKSTCLALHFETFKHSRTSKTGVFANLSDFFNFGEDPLKNADLSLGFFIADIRNIYSGSFYFSYDFKINYFSFWVNTDNLKDLIY